MKSKCVVVFLGIGLMAVQAFAEEAPVLKTPRDQVNYSLGVGVARNFKRQGMDIDPEMVIRGMRDVFGGGTLLMNESDIRKATTAYQAEVRQKRAMDVKSSAVENRKKGEAFLAVNRSKEGVVSLPSGLQYKILTAGKGRKPTDKDTVEINYRGTSIDGIEFNSSERQGKPAVFKVSGSMVPGITEGLKLMPLGSKWQFFVPSKLAYGERGVGAEIGPNETLIFEVELLSIK